MKRIFRDIKEFSTDGCTMSPDFDFRDCCVRHDLDYWRGDVTRAEADRRLRQCIKEKGYVVLPWIYWAGVRLFGAGRFNRIKKHRRFP
jgi:hypothetical protein